MPKCERIFKNENQSHYCGKAPTTADEYILAQNEGIRIQLQSVRIVLKDRLPDDPFTDCPLSGDFLFFKIEGYVFNCWTEAGTSMRTDTVLEDGYGNSRVLKAHFTASETT
ncbi:MAG: hypothetical protein Q4D81_09010 [Eubacteriales bacterium]|nr:hypothetical protein [Eubacteriales bacterium]